MDFAAASSFVRSPSDATIANGPALMQSRISAGGGGALGPAGIAIMGLIVIVLTPASSGSLTFGLRLTNSW